MAGPALIDPALDVRQNLLPLRVEIKAVCGDRPHHRAGSDAALLEAA